MKRNFKKLSLHRETLHRLVPMDLMEVAGGHTNEIVTSCMGTKLCGTTGCTGTGGTGTCGNTNQTCTRQFVGCCTVHPC